MNIALIIPTLNPGPEFPEVIRRFLEEGFEDIIVVNDGSPASYQPIFDKAADMHGVTLLTHEVNQGKGRALKTAFEYCIRRNQTYHAEQLSCNNTRDCPGYAGNPTGSAMLRLIDGAITVDSDGQHLPQDVHACADALAQNPDVLILGARDFQKPEVPFRSRIGNGMTSFVFRFACGIHIHDTQTGLRGFGAIHFPLLVSIKGERYEYETEVLLEMHRQNIALKEIPIHTVYINENEGSHFHPVRDSFRIYGVILKFILSSLLSFLVDYGVFTLLVVLIAGQLPREQRILIATATARILSSLVNFMLNKKLVFRSEASTASTLVKYYALCIVQAAASYGLVYAMSCLFRTAGFAESLIKIAVDLCLAVMSFLIQRHFVFR